jgi:hypothetical protein
MYDSAAYITNMAKTSWVFIIFGEHQVMAQLIVKRVLISPLINKASQPLTPENLR